MLHHRIGLMRLAVCCLAVLAVSVAGPEPALAKRAANYGIDWTGVGTGEYTRFDAAIRSAYYQQLDGYVTMDRDRATGANLYDKLSGTDPNDYDVLTVVTHGNQDGIVTRRRDGEATIASGLFSVTPWSAAIVNDTRVSIGEARDVRTLTSVPHVRWMVYQGCDTAYIAPMNISYATYLEGVDTVVGFKNEIWTGGVGTNGQTRHYNFAARYWKSLQLGEINSVALLDGAWQVYTYHYHDFNGYLGYRIYGLNSYLF